MFSARRIAGLFAVLAVAVLATSCGSTQSPTAQVGARVVRVDQSANGRTLHLAVGARLVVSLNSTYWSFTGDQNSTVLRAGMPQTRAVLPGSTSSCAPGQGCGTLSDTFVALAAGSTHVRATRTTCGEAMLCRPDQRRFAVTVIVD